MLIRKGLVVWIILLFIASELIPLTPGINNRNKNNTDFAEKCCFDRYLYPEYYHFYNASEISDFKRSNLDKKQTDIKNIGSEIENYAIQSSQPLDGLMDSPWPMQSHDARHTGRSSFNTTNTLDEIWRFQTKGWAMSSPAIDRDGNIYFGAWNFYAMNPNGTLKWIFKGGIEASCPAIDENGTIYIGAHESLCALYPNGTLKWSHAASGIEASPVIGGDGTIYFADTNNWNIKALYPNGTLKWSYHTNMVIYSSPAIGFDGTIYCGSFDGNIYALYPNNGTLKWSYGTGTWVHGAPTIADDGTVYIGSDNGYFYAFYPDNGTLKWALNIGSIWGSPALDKDGTIYTGVWEDTFFAIYPNGTIKWSFNTEAHVWGSSPALSDDGTLYFGTCNLDYAGGIEIIALYTDGTVKWRKSLDTVFSSPAIGSDGTVYICSNGEPGDGYLHAFGQLDPNAPAAPAITGQINGKTKTIYDYTFTSSSPLGKHIYYSIDWGDGSTTDWLGPFNSSESIMMNHSWVNKGTYAIKARARDTDNLWGPYGTLEVTMPLSYKPPHFRFFDWFLERFPHAFPIIRFLLDFNHCQSFSYW
jgi:outer membrane protein assembly factor BamB